jgi:outer membrane protein OmpA-like peptidoglycan-associated protein
VVPNRETPRSATAATAATTDSHAVTTDSHAAAADSHAVTTDSHAATADSQVAASDSLSLDSLIQESESRAARRSAEERTRRNVVFGIIGETAIPETQKAMLDELVGLLKGHPDLRISIEGHFCDSLKEMENSQTAAARTKAVVRYLENKGISRRRMDISYTRESDAVLSYDPAANYRNRRVAIRIIGSF